MSAARAAHPRRRPRQDAPELAPRAEVNLVQEIFLVPEVEVLPQIAGRFLAWGAREGHVQGDQAGAFASAPAIAPSLTGLFHCFLDDLRLGIGRTRLLHWLIADLLDRQSV